jgi:hypothetical protein
VRRSDLLWGLILVVVGVALLLDRLLGISLWKAVWPLLLIGLGLWFLWSASRGEEPLEEEEVTIPVGGAERAHIQMRHGAGQARVGASADASELVSGTFVGGLDYERESRGDTVYLRMRPSLRASRFLMPWFRRGGFSWDFGLSPSIPLSLRVDGGMSSMNLDLSDLQVTDLQLKTGMSATEVTLPVGAGHTRAEIDSGMASVRIQVPEGVAARIRTESGLASIAVDRQRFPRTGSVYQSEDYDQSENRVDILIKSGLGSVTVG